MGYETFQVRQRFNTAVAVENYSQCDSRTEKLFLEQCSKHYITMKNSPVGMLIRARTFKNNRKPKMGPFQQRPSPRNVLNFLQALYVLYTAVSSRKRLLK